MRKTPKMKTFKELREATKFIGRVKTMRGLKLRVVDLGKDKFGIWIDGDILKGDRNKPEVFDSEKDAMAAGTAFAKNYEDPAGI